MLRQLIREGDDDIEAIDIKAVRKRFQGINRERMRRVQGSLRWRQRDFLDLLPLFFHINHAMLPGYISKNTPFGIPLYTPTKASIDAAKRLAKSLDYRRRAMRSYDIHSIFLMGSVGTIGHSDESDFDIWICHRSDLTEEETGLLRAKCSAIEEWARTIDLEVHFFLMDPERFRQGGVHELSTESSGSTQHHLLLEEFYRTGLLVAGRYPVWWMVPPEHEGNYSDFVEELVKRRYTLAGETIDFGGMDQIPAEEFFGAALWQVYKGIDSPFKSVLKILLMECFASEYPDTELLSLQYKRMVYSGVIDLNELDPYIVLYKRLEAYLEKRNEPERLELLRRCLYFKVGLPLSRRGEKGDWRREVLGDLVKEWRWTEGQIATLDSREHWKIRRVLAERKILVDELTHSYLFLSNFARAHSGFSRIEQKDLNILGRKLYAAFERKAGKVELINRGISSHIEEMRLTIARAVRASGEETWSLHVGAESSGEEPLKRSRSLLELVCWMHFNRLFNPGTMLSLEVRGDSLTMRELRALLEVLQSRFPDGYLPATTIEDFSRPPFIITGAVFVNIGVDPLPLHTRRGTDLISDKSDVLNYSGFSFNLVHTLDLLIITSWQEVLTYRFAGVNGLLDCLCQYLRWHTESEIDSAVRLLAHCFASSHGHSIARRITELFLDIADWFYQDGALQDARYILEIEQTRYLFYTEQGALRYRRAARFDELLEMLSEPHQGYCPVRCDRNALHGTVLPAILRKNEPGIIQLFYEKISDTEADIYVLDENGSLFYQRSAFYDDTALLSQYGTFLNSVLSRQSFLLQDTNAMDLMNAIEFFKIGKNQSGKYAVARQQVSPDKLDRRYVNVQVIGDVVDQNTVFTIYCDDHEFSSFDHGKNLFLEVARYVLSQRRSGQRYPIYITDIDLSPGLLGNRASGSVQAIDFLNYKKRIEHKINKELEAL